MATGSDTIGRNCMIATPWRRFTTYVRQYEDDRREATTAIDISGHSPRSTVAACPHP